MADYLLDAFVYLCAAVVAVPLARRLGLGSVLGYLIAGVVIGPVLQLVRGSETEALQHVAEFGVVMMLFVVGLELEPRMLWRMRDQLLGLGGLQVAATTALFCAIGLTLGFPWQVAVAVGMILALSSTAIVLQTFSERGLGGTPGGRSAFSVLLMQDMAVIPMLALIPLLALPELAGGGYAGDQHGATLTEGLPAWAYALVLLGAIAAVVFGGHFLSRPLFRYIADAGLREAFTAASLALVIGVAVLMSLVGLSPALGTFLAGVVLANSEFRHELESNIEPFKGLLLGLFFITVGAGIDFAVLAEQPGRILLLTLAVMALKAVVLFGIASLFGVRRSDGWLFTLSLAQAGEFGFVLIGFSLHNSVLPAGLAPILSLVVGLSMFLTPLLFIAYDRLVLPRYTGGDPDREPDVIEEQAPVIIAGIGRFGQIVNRVLTVNGIPTVVLDRDAGQIENMRKVGFKTYYGDVTRSDLLHTAGAAEASLLVIAIDQPDEALKVVREVRRRYPQLRMLVRAYDRGHRYALQEAGADWIVIETYHSALCTAEEALRATGMAPELATRRRQAFEALEQAGHETLFKAWQKGSEGERYGTDYRELYMDLHRAMQEISRQQPDGEPAQ